MERRISRPLIMTIIGVSLVGLFVTGGCFVYLVFRAFNFMDKVLY